MKRKALLIIALVVVLALGATLWVLDGSLRQRSDDREGQEEAEAAEEAILPDYVSSLWQRIGEHDAQAETDGELTVIALIRGEEFAVNSGHLENACYFYQHTQEPLNEAEVRELYVANELLYREGQEQGLNAGPAEVDERIAALKENLSGDPEGYAELKAYLQGLGLSEDEYWETHREEYQRELTIEKLGEKLREEYFSRHPYDTAEQYQQYYRDVYRAQLFNKYQVEMV